MTEYSKRFENFEALYDELKSSGFYDEVLNPADYEFLDYNDIRSRIMQYVDENNTGIFASDYPYCISFSIGSYGYRYMKNGIGLSISTYYNKSTQKVNYTLTFCFDKPDELLRNNDAYNFVCGDDDYRYKYTPPKENRKNNKTKVEEG